MLNLDDSISKAVKLLKSGNPVAIPTETVYGLAAPINNPEAIKKIFSLKERPFFDPLIVHISSINELSNLTNSSSETLLKIANKFWPGPLTMILPKKDNINPMITSGLNSVGIRFPSHPIARNIIEAVGVPLAAPSANKFGKTSPTKAEHVRKTWNEDEVFVVDGGSSEIGIESSVIEIDSKTKKISILRKGYITKEMLSELLGSDYKIEYIESSASPGHTPHHYMPEKPLVIINSENWKDNQTILSQIQTKLKIKNPLSFDTLELNLDPLIAARLLYESLHQFSNSANEYIVVVKNMPDSNSSNSNSHWEAIWDRIKRASSLEIN